MDAVIYLRISQDRSGLEAGVQRQSEDCLRRASERGWTVVATESDNDVSAAGKRARPGFERMLQSINDGRAQVVIAWALDRLQRNRRDELRLYEACQRNGVVLSLVNGADLDFSTAAGRFVADSLGSVARLEIEMKSDRQKSATAQAAKQGRRVGGRRPFGYEADGVTVRENEAAAIRLAYEEVLSGVPLAEIARGWNRAGFVTGQRRYKEGHEGEPSIWHAYSVRMVLRNPRNMGKRAHLGEIVAEATWPAIVSEETWQAVSAFLANPARSTGKAQARYLLSGLAVCGVCGAPVHAGGNARRGVRGYRCSAAGGHFARRAEPVEDYLSRVVVARLSQPDARNLLSDSKNPDVKQLRIKLVGLRERLEGVAIEYADGAITAAQLRAATERLTKHVKEAEAELADAGRVDVLGELIDASDVHEVWERLSLSKRRAVIATLMKVSLQPVGRGTRNFDPATVGIEWLS